jgi:hypothetical protein
MTYYPDFDPYFIRERHKELLREAEHQRLVREARKKARENREPRSGLSNLTAVRRFSPSSWKVSILGSSSPRESPDHHSFE